MEGKAVAWCLAVLALVLAGPASAIQVSDDTHRAQQVLQSAPPERLRAALAEIDSQVHAVMSLDAQDEAEELAAEHHEAHMRAKGDDKKEDKKEDKKDKAELNVSLKNMLDMKTLAATIKPGEKAAQPRHVIVAFIQIAQETIQRARAALQQLKAGYKSGLYNLKVHNHDMYAWVANQKSIAEYKIKAEEERIGKLTDEMVHLQHIYRDALAKEKAYQTQSSQLVSERQLQSTPPLIPAVAAASVSETEYKSALMKLEKYREAALQIMSKTAKGVATREHIIELATNWVKDSKGRLKKWLAKQGQIIETRKQSGMKQVQLWQAREKNVKVLLDDANAKHKEYLHALRRVDLEKRISVLKGRLLKYKGIVTQNAYDLAHQRAYVKALELEIKSLKAKLKELGGDSEVEPPPAAWGILAGFAPPHFAGAPGAPQPMVPPAGVDPHAPAITAYMQPDGVHRGLPADPSVTWFEKQHSQHMGQLAQTAAGEHLSGGVGGMGGALDAAASGSGSGSESGEAAFIEQTAATKRIQTDGGAEESFPAMA